MKYEILEIGEHKMAVRFGFNALRKYSLMTGATMNDLNKLASGQLTFNDAFSLIYCGIEDGYRASKQPFNYSLVLIPSYSNTSMLYFKKIFQ